MVPGQVCSAERKADIRNLADRLLMGAFQFKCTI